MGQVRAAPALDFRWQNGQSGLNSLQLAVYHPAKLKDRLVVLLGLPCGRCFITRLVPLGNTRPHCAGGRGQSSEGRVGAQQGPGSVSLRSLVHT
jgi:hypothetical protein